MKIPPLFRRHTIWLPTWPFAILIAALLGLSISLTVKNLATFLAINEPVDADYLIIEGWMGMDELTQAYEIFTDKGYRYAIVSGGPISDPFNTGFSNYADRGSDYLKKIGFPADKLTAVASPYSAQDRTFLSAVLVRDWVIGQDNQVSKIDVFTSNVHARRSRLLFQLAFGNDINVGILASKPLDFELSSWWRSSSSAKSVAIETMGYIAAHCCFTPGKRGSHYEKWGLEKSTKN